MKEAICEAELGAAAGEVPVGAVIVRGGEIIGRGHNLTQTSKDPTAHAEMIAIREASKRPGHRLSGCSLYVTVEPCVMCAGAIVLARIDKLIIGAMDPKGGACGSVYDIPAEGRLNHSPEVVTGVMEEECAAMMSEFFEKLRQRPGRKAKTFLRR